MGTYTEFKVKFRLKKDAPDQVVNFLKKTILDRDLNTDKVILSHGEVYTPDIDHEFFKCSRWYHLFLYNNWDPDINGSTMVKRTHNWEISIHTEFKDYDDEIDKFVDWISPYISNRKKRKSIGWYKPEYGNRINIYINE